MSKEKKKTMVPKLRFPEFREAGEWEPKKLGELIDIKGRIGYRGYTVEDIVKEGEGAIALSPSNINDAGSLSFEKSTYITWYKYEESPEIMLKVGQTILVKTGSSYGKAAFVKELREKCTINPQLVVLKPIKIDSIFLFLLVCHNSIQKQINETVVGGAIPTLSQDSISKFEVLIPSKPEQQKIAATLSSLDDLIAAQSEKIKALQAHKKGLMQQLFPAEGERVPRVRFGEFRESGEWEEAPFDKLYSFKMTNSFSRDNLNYEMGSVKNIHYGDIHTKFATLFDIKKETVPFVNPSVPIDKIKSDSYCVEGDMIFADASEDLNDVGKSIEIISLNNERLLSGLHTIMARQIKSKLIVGFAGHLFKSIRVRSQIQKEAQGAKVLGISAGRLSNISVCYPKSKDEQQKIAATLSSLDDLIAAQNEKLEALKAHKKGLMQQLFPNPNEENI